MPRQHLTHPQAVGQLPEPIMVRELVGNGFKSSDGRRSLAPNANAREPNRWATHTGSANSGVDEQRTPPGPDAGGRSSPAASTAKDKPNSTRFSHYLQRSSAGTMPSHPLAVNGINAPWPWTGRDELRLRTPFIGNSRKSAASIRRPPQTAIWRRLINCAVVVRRFHDPAGLGVREGAPGGGRRLVGVVPDRASILSLPQRSRDLIFAAWCAIESRRLPDLAGRAHQDRLKQYRSCKRREEREGQQLAHARSPRVI